MSFVEELEKRGMIHDIMPGTEELLNKELTTAYVGIDPTADSLHIGHLVSVMMLTHFQRAGHKPILLIGGATAMIGDPSFKSQERVLLSLEEIRYNQEKIKGQLSKFLDFEGRDETKAEMLNNYDWLSKWNFLEFIRDIGKHITVNYMMSKDSVKSRLDTGISFTEFSYQLLQAYDFLHLYQDHNCKLQMGGSDQWGNITTGTELIRKTIQGNAFALTCPLITKSDGGKFGKTEDGNIWLDADKTSPYEFYQFWLNTSDEDAERFIKIFTLFPIKEIESMIEDHRKEPHRRLLQRTLAEDITTRVHSKEDYEKSVEASNILFGKSTTEALRNIDERTFLSVFEGVPRYVVSKALLLDEGIEVIELLAEETSVFPSKSDLRRTIKENALSINKEKVDGDKMINSSDLLNDKYILVQRGRKNYYLIIAE